MRQQLADFISRVHLNQEQVVITKYGQPVAALVPLTAVPDLQLNIPDASFEQALKAGFGIWRDRPDMPSGKAWVEKNRQPRYSLNQEEKSDDT